MEQYEIATVTAVGKPGTQAYLAMEAPAGATNIQVTSLSDISAGDKIRLDIDSVGHGIETVTVTHVGTAANQTCKDEGPLTLDRSRTVDEEISGKVVDYFAGGPVAAAAIMLGG